MNCITFYKRKSESAYERAIIRLRSDPAQDQFVRWCYLDDTLAAARRFSCSEEFSEVCRILSLGDNGKGLRILDVGSGNGIAAFAFASLGYDVVALEPDPGSIVGVGAIRQLLPYLLKGSICAANVPVGEYQDAAGFDIIYMRQVAHHFPVLEDGLVYCANLLKPGGILLMSREHVIDTCEDLELFRQRHPLVKDGVEETAYPARRYRDALIRAGFEKICEWGSFDSVINYYPTKAEATRNLARSWIIQRFGKVGDFLFLLFPRIERWILHRISLQDRTLGRMYTFMGLKTIRRKKDN